MFYIAPPNLNQANMLFGHHVRSERGIGGGDRADRIRSDSVWRVGAAGGADGCFLNITVSAKIISIGQETRWNSRSIGNLELDCPLLFRTVNLGQVFLASLSSGVFTSPQEAGDRDSNQDTDDCHDDHDFNEREALGGTCIHISGLYYGGLGFGSFASILR